MNLDWKMASIIGMLIVLGLNTVIVASPLEVFFSVLIIPLFNWFANTLQWRILTGQWTYKSCIVAKISKYDDSVYYVVYCLTDGRVVSKYFFRGGAKSRADEYLKSLYSEIHKIIFEYASSGNRWGFFTSGISCVVSGFGK
jgi:hypothetical protein